MNEGTILDQEGGGQTFLHRRRRRRGTLQSLDLSFNYKLPSASFISANRTARCVHPLLQV